MSSALNTAIYNRLCGVEALTGKWATAQAAIIAALGADPDTSLPNVFRGNLNDAPTVLDANSVAMPVITYRRSGGIPNHAFAHGTAVDACIYDFEVWDWHRTANGISAITDAIDRLFDRRMQCPAMTLTAGYVAWADPFVEWNELSDDSRNAWVGLGRYVFIELRE